MAIVAWAYLAAAFLCLLFMAAVIVGAVILTIDWLAWRIRRWLTFRH